MESMTGYGESRGVVGGRQAVVRARSVNGRHLDVKTRLPRFEQPTLEQGVRKLATEIFKRGSIEISVAFDANDAGPAAGELLDFELASRYAQAAKLIGDRQSGMMALTLDALVRLPGVVKTELDSFEPDASAIESLLKGPALEAMNALKKEREKEGAKLKTHILGLLSEIQSAFDAITKLEPEERKKQQELVMERAKKTAETMKAASNGPLTPEFDARLREEAAFWLDRRDFEEERMRFAAHLARFKELVSAPTPAIGRQLEFQHQEILREINTLGNKAASIAISAHVVEIKTQLERIREQLANVE